MRYIDHFEERGGEWKVAHRVVVFEWVQEEIGELQFNPTWAVAQRSQDDMVYRIHETQTMGCPGPLAVKTV